jgi:hypothetical protein
MRYALILSALLALATGCIEVTAPAAPGYVPFKPPAEYARVWTDIEKCSGFTGDFSKVKFFVYPNEVYIPGHDHAAAMSRIKEKEIYITGRYQDNLATVGHEYLHVMGKLYCHDPKYFDKDVGLCKEIVYSSHNDC